MKNNLYGYLQHSPRWPLVEGRPVAPQGAEPGHRAGGTPLPHPPETPQRTAKGKLGDFCTFYFQFCKTIGLIQQMDGRVWT
jgi:hypothetical protein